MKASTRKSLEFHFKALASKDASQDCVIEGYANTSTKDRVGDVVLPAAFEKSLPTYLKNPVLLANHDWNDPVGRVIHAEITDKGLYIKAKISETRPDIKTLIKEGVLSTFSIGYNEVTADYDEATKTKYVKELELLEISIVTVPANTEASFVPATAKEEGADGGEAKVGDKDKAPKSAADLVAYISSVKSVFNERSLDGNQVVAICDYFNSNEVVMTKEELLKALRAEIKSTKADDKPAGGKPDGADAKPTPPEEKPEGAEGDDDAELDKQMLAKLDAIAQACAQLLERMDKLEKDEAAEDEAEAAEDGGKDKPAEEKPADDGEKSAACEKCGEPVAKGEDGKMKCKNGHVAEDAAKEDAGIKDEDVEKHIAELDEQIAALEDSENG